MPSTIIHEKVGYEIGKKLHLNSYDYYLGLLAPDAPNLNGFAEKKKRWEAHVRRKDLNDWRNSLKEFYLNNKKNYNKDFLIGYFIHILTDIIYDDFYYFQVKEIIIKDNYKKEEAHQIMSNDMEKYFFKEFNIIKNILEKSTITYNINNINEELLLNWKNKIIKRNITENKSKYISESLLYNLTNKVLEEALDFLNY